MNPGNRKAGAKAWQCCYCGTARYGWSLTGVMLFMTGVAVVNLGLPAAI